MENGDGPDPGPGLAPEAVEDTEFATVRRGYEPGPVRTRLREAADEIRRLNALVGSLSSRVARLEDTPPDQLESRRVAEALGDEATRVLQSASDAARERTERAEAEHHDIVGKAQATAAVIVEEAREQGREMVFEARNVRERILADLARKRHEHRIEVEQLRVIHDRFSEALSICRQELDGWMEELAQTEPQAVVAAERAGQRLGAVPEPTVAEIEAEIEAARLVGMPLDRGPDEAESGDDTRADPAADTRADPAADTDDADDAEPEQAEQAAGDAAAPSADGGDEPDGLEDLDEMEEPSEYVEIVGYAVDPSATPSARAAVGLYDVEAEADAVFEAGGGLPEAQAPDPADAASTAVGDALEPAVEAAAASGAEAIFARLRSITTRPVRERSVPPQGVPPAAGNGAAPSDEPVAPEPAAAEPAVESAAVESAAAEPAVESAAAEPAVESAAAEPAVESAAAEPATAAREPSEPDDLVSAARAVAVGGIARGLKRLVVDEQGDLLDAIRRNGARALRGTISADTRAYVLAARVPMQDFASDIDVSIDDIDLEAAGDAIVSVMVEPVRARLDELVEDTEDPDELSSAVRSIYRESRSRRADTAAETAFAAGWPEPIT